MFVERIVCTRYTGYMKRVVVWYKSILAYFSKHAPVTISVIGVTGSVLLAVGVILVVQGQKKILEVQKNQLQLETHTLLTQLNDVRNEDQYIKNVQLAEKNTHIQTTYGQAVTAYETLLDLRGESPNTSALDKAFANILSLLAHEQWATASAEITKFSGDIASARAKLAAAIVIPQNVTQSNTAPSSGFSRQSVTVDGTQFLVDLIAGDLGSTKVIVDTASEHDCANDCPTLSLSEYVARNNAYAGVNGSYFCPAEYPSCAGKTNSFDTLLMNKNKTYFNSANNVYSTVPAVIFLGSSLRFVGQSLEWGRDTSPDSLIANRPLLVSGGGIAFSGEGEPKEGNKGNRSFVANKGTVAYIGVVHGASVAESAKVLHELGMDNAINLDDGGSTALWSGGYKVGPGRNLPNAILFVRK